MDLTVCICTHDRPRYLRDCLDGLRSQTVAEDRFAILIVDSASSEPARSELRDLLRQYPTAHLLRIDEPGVSAARNAGARAATTDYIAYIDDDAIPSETWVEAILDAINERGCDRPALLGGRILPKWEALLPAWWPPALRGLLSIIEHEGTGEYRSNELPPALEPYGCNMIVHVRSLLDTGGFGCAIGRIAGILLSDEDIQLAWRLQDEGFSVRYDSNIVVFHQIQAKRLNPEWLLSRLYWQGASTVLSRRMLHDGNAVWRELPRRLLAAILFAPAAWLPKTSTECLAMRWRQAYSAGFVRAALGWRATEAARRMAQKPAPLTTAPIARLPTPVPPPSTIRVPERLPLRGRTREPVYTPMRKAVRLSSFMPAREPARPWAMVNVPEPASLPLPAREPAQATVTARRPALMPPPLPAREAVRELARTTATAAGPGPVQPPPPVRESTVHETNDHETTIRETTVREPRRQPVLEPSEPGVA
jgi:glycosyltransferase involved in cell wall biosynthesis